jgi:ribosomal protein S17
MAVKFPHKAPKGYHYEQTTFKKHITAIWIHDDRTYDYNNGKHVRCIWGFYNSKTTKYHSPINSGTVGDVVDPIETTPYSAMILKRTPLEAAFV